LIRRPSGVYLVCLSHSWNVLRLTEEGLKLFKQILEQDGWKSIADMRLGVWKCVYVHKNYDVVIKFDNYIGKQSHSRTELMKWRHAKPQLKKYLAPIYYEFRGLLVQRRVEECLDERNCKEVSYRAKRLVRSTHWRHHTHKPHLLFFDYDSLG
jgi:hypothetical protein